MFARAVLASVLCVALQASASLLDGPTVDSFVARSVHDDSLRRHADDLVRTLERRQSTTTLQGTNAASFDLAAWNTQTQAACLSAMGALNGQASNPSGLSVCYNVPFFDNSTGLFQAELRLYRVSQAVDVWDGVDVNDFSMALSYVGAEVQSSDEKVSKRDHHISWPPVKRNGAGLINRQSSLEELKVLTYVARVNSNVMSAVNAQSDMQTILSPNITLTATNKNTQGQINTALSSTEAAFVNGAFSRKATVAPDSAAAVAAATSLAAQVIPLAVPGLKLAFFPTGLVVTLIWTGLFCLAVGLGTVQRFQYREQYRRRMQRQMASGWK